jgi:hypothetical protein
MDMTARMQFRALVVLAATGLAAAMGCGSERQGAGTTPVRAVKDSPQAPRALVLPERMTALAAPREAFPACNTHASALAGFEQPGSGTVTARIRDLSVAPSAAAPGLIREPAAAPEPRPAIARTLPPPDLRSPYVPLEMPAQPAAPPKTALPELPPRPVFADDSLRTPRPEYVTREYVSRDEPAFQPQQEPPRQFAPAQAPPVDRTAMQPVSQRALEISNHAYGLAQRGMLYAARAELIQSLQLVAQALDVQQNTTAHAASLSAGLTALKEAQDFSPPAGQLAGPLDVADLVRAHQTPVLKELENASPVVAQQQYLGYAQSQLARATGKEAVASLTLFRLGKLQMAMAQHESDPQMLHGPQAMAYYQAALAADDRNFLAANELGVLMARYGQLQEARRLLVHSVSINPQVEAWHNLSIVHQRLGEADLARLAAHERELLAQSSPAPATAGGNVEWVDAKTFAAAAGGEVPWTENVVRRSAAGPGGEAAQTAARPSWSGSASYGRSR